MTDTSTPARNEVTDENRIALAKVILENVWPGWVYENCDDEEKLTWLKAADDAIAFTRKLDAAS